MTVICWGTYGVCMHTGSMNMKNPEHGRIMAFLWVGLAYFLTAVIAPIIILKLKGAPIDFWAYPAKGWQWSLIAGTLGAIGALGVLLWVSDSEERWRAFGWAAARFDDLLNWIPARLAGVLICLAGGGGWRVLWRDARRHASPNAGWPEAAMAGALGLALGGPRSYGGKTAADSWLGDGRQDAVRADVVRALSLYRLAGMILAVLLLALALV